MKTIPKGCYCYAGVLGRKLCYHYTSIYDEGVRIPYCSFLKKGDISMISEIDFEKLVSKYKDTIYDVYPLYTLWDQVKECGINE